MRIVTKEKIVAGAIALLCTGLTAGATQVGSYRYNSGANAFTSDQGGVTIPITGNFGTMTIEGSAAGTQAWRTDGFTSRAAGQLGNLVYGNQMSATLRFAIDTYPIIGHERAEISNENIQVDLAGCLNEGAGSGFAFTIGRTGRYAAQIYVGGQLVTVEGDGILPLWEWTELTVTVDGTNVRLYRNGEEVGSATASASGVKVGDTELHFAIGNRHDYLGGAEICGINGAYESLVIDNTATVPSFTASYADLYIPASRYANDRFRARFHGMPGQNWTNETHGLYYNAADGKYHAFFQRTGSAPIMSHQHWGHIISDDLITWKDEKPALAPSEPYDIKGCWSGCVFSDPAFNGGNPTIIYTGVDFAKPYVATAYCDDPTHLRLWHKDPTNPLDVFGDIGDGRDTYFYRDGDNAYFLIGSRDAVHYYKWDGSKWNYKGEFYHTQEGVDNGHNTEMPNVTNMGDGKWIMTTSPLAGMYGTTCLYRVGSLSDGKFVDYGEAKKVDLFGRDGYGLLSPSISKTPDGRTVALGIVPDKMQTQVNIDLGYAHLYSLPREWKVIDGELYQTPAKEIYEYRDKNSKFELKDFELEGTRSLETVRGRAAEVNATFVVGDSPFGINFLKNAQGKGAKLVYTPANGELKVDFGSLPRLNDDMNINSFSALLPERPAAGEEMKLQMFIDRSILDIFVNDHYAASVRVYPTDDASDLIEVFADGKTTLKSVEAYLLGEGGDTYGQPVVPVKPEVLETTGKVALYIGYKNLEELTEANMSIDIHEGKAIYDYFVSKFPTGTVLFSGDVDKIKASDFDCLWVACDRPGIEQGWENLPEAF
ncbi:MAG: GH32 C-terminal domain-containing protein, partial [Muribaculaceae bacterium]|nr:GH32 C-terminal domain-containing protein [Muribaculaceae bacterium]